MKETRSYRMTTRAASVASTRERITRAAHQLLLTQDFADVTLDAIAKAAEVSHQTVLNHFESKEGVVVAVAELFRQEVDGAREKARPGDTAGALRILVGEYERSGDSNARWAMSSERLGSLAPLMDEARAYHRAWLEELFADRLPAPPRRARAVHALHAATDVYTWKLLRRDLRLSRADTERTMVDLAEGVLDGRSRHTT